MKYKDVMQNSLLFKDIDDLQLESMLQCLGHFEKSYSKEQVIFHMGDEMKYIGMVLSGSVHIVKEDFWGRRSIIANITSGQIFGETYSCLDINKLEVSVVSNDKTVILFLDINKVMKLCSKTCIYRSNLIRNLVTILASKNLMLTKKLENVSQRTIREKLLSYLSSVSINKRTSEFVIPFNRQELADYLSVDRSALSNELSKLRDEGILKFEKNKFVLTNIKISTNRTNM